MPNQLRRFETILAALDTVSDGEVDSEAESDVEVSFGAMEGGFEGEEGGRRVALEVEVLGRGRDETEEIEGARFGLRFIDGIKSSAEVVERVGCEGETMLPGLVEFDRLGRVEGFVKSGMGGRSRCRLAEAVSATSFALPFPFSSGPVVCSSTSIRSSSSSRTPPCEPLIVTTELAELAALFLPFAVPSPFPLSVKLLPLELNPLLTLILSSSSSISAFFLASNE